MLENDSNDKLSLEEIVSNTTVEKESNKNEMINQDKDNEIVSIDCNHTIVHKAKLLIFQKKADQLNQIIKQLSLEEEAHSM